MRRPLSVVLLLALSAPAYAEDSATAAAAKVRASIPVPEEEKGLAFEWNGDLAIAGEWAGTVRYGADTGTYKDKPVWLVTEEIVQDFGGTKTSQSASYYLARDLSFVRGEWHRTTPDAELNIFLVRTEAGVVATRERVTTDKGVEALPPVVIAAPADATLGRAALLLFLKYAPSGAARYAVPLVDVESAIPAVTEHEVPPDATPARIEVKGAAKYGTGRDAIDSWMAKIERTRQSVEVHLTPKERSLIGIEYLVPPGTRIVPKGAAGKKSEYGDEKPADSWRAAFLKLGHGYHMAIPKLMEEAVHWKTMLDYEISIYEPGVKGYAKDTTVEGFRREWIEEFLKRSKHRPREQADALLAMTIATGTTKTEKDGTVVLATSPEFGGNVFHMREIDKVWYVIRMDQ